MAKDPDPEESRVAYFGIGPPLWLNAGLYLGGVCSGERMCGQIAVFVRPFDKGNCAVNRYFSLLCYIPVNVKFESWHAACIR